MRITKTLRLIDHMRAGDWSRALSLANTFRKLGTHRDTIRLAHECRVYPRFYRSLGRDPDTARRRRHRGAHTALPREDAMKLHTSLTPERIMEACERYQQSLDNPGFCIACGCEAEGVEPDAEKYICESCGAPSVYGAEQLLIATF